MRKRFLRGFPWRECQSPDSFLSPLYFLAAMRQTVYASIMTFFFIIGPRWQDPESMKSLKAWTELKLPPCLPTQDQRSISPINIASWVGVGSSLRRYEQLMIAGAGESLSKVVGSLAGCLYSILLSAIHVHAPLIGLSGSPRDEKVEEGLFGKWKSILGGGAQNRLISSKSDQTKLYMCA